MPQQIVSSPTGVEQRQCARIPYHGRVTMLWGGRKITGEALDLSPRGISLIISSSELGPNLTLQRLVLGARLRLFYTSPDIPGVGQVSITGQVVRVQPMGEDHLNDLMVAIDFGNGVGTAPAEHEVQ